MTQSYRGGSFDPNESRLNWEQSISENAKWQDRAAQQANEIIKMNARTREAEAGKGWDTLAELSPTVGKWIEKKHTEHLANEEAKGAEWYYLNGFPQDQAEAYDLAEQKENEASYDLNELTADMEAKGENIFVTDRYRKLSNAAKLGAIKAYTQSKASTYSPETIPQIVNAVDPTERNAALTAYRMDFFKQFQGINPAILNKHLYPTIRANESNAYKSWYATRAKEQKEARIQKAGVELGTSLFAESDKPNAKVEAIMHFVNSTHTDYGSKRLARNAAMAYLKTLAEQGKITDDFLAEIKAGEFVAHDGSKQTFGKYYRDEIVGIEEAQKTFKKNQLKDIQDKRRREEQAVFGAYDEQIHDRKLSGTLTLTFIDSLPKHYPPEKIKKLKDYVAEQKGTDKEFLSAISAINTDVSNRANQSTQLKDDSSILKVQGILTQKFKERVRDLELTDKDITRSQAIQQAKKETTEWFNNATDKNVKFLTNRGYDTKLIENGELKVLPKSDELNWKLDQLKAKYNSLGRESLVSVPNEEGYNNWFHSKEIASIKQDLLNADKGYGYTENAMIRFLADQNPDLTYMDVLKLQLDNFGISFTEEEMALTKGLKFVDGLNQDLKIKIDNANSHYQSARAWMEFTDYQPVGDEDSQKPMNFLSEIVPDGLGEQCLEAAEGDHKKACEIASAMELLQADPNLAIDDFENISEYMTDDKLKLYFVNLGKYSGGSLRTEVLDYTKREGI